MKKRTRDQVINGRVTHGYWLRHTEPKRQAREIIQRFDLREKIDPFIRCLECNEPLISVNKASIQDRLPLKTKKYFKSFVQCPRCHRVYWEDSHLERM